MFYFPPGMLMEEVYRPQKRNDKGYSGLERDAPGLYHSAMTKPVYESSGDALKFTYD